MFSKKQKESQKELIDFYGQMIDIWSICGINKIPKPKLINPKFHEKCHAEYNEVISSKGER